MSKVLTELADSHFRMRTVGLSTAGKPEIVVEFNDWELNSGVEVFLNYVSYYLTSSGGNLRPGETMAYGYWMTKFQDAGSHALEAWEYNPPGHGIREGRFSDASLLERSARHMQRIRC